MDSKNTDGSVLRALYPDRPLMPRKGLMEAGVLVDPEPVYRNNLLWYKLPAPANIKDYTVTSKGLPLQLEGDSMLVSHRSA